MERSAMRVQHGVACPRISLRSIRATCSISRGTRKHFFVGILKPRIAFRSIFPPKFMQLCQVLRFHKFLIQKLELIKLRDWYPANTACVQDCS